MAGSSMILGVSAFGLVAGAAASDERSIDFQRDVRPLLADRCFACHGPDEGQRKAKLRLDTFEGATSMRDGVRAIVPGSPDESELVARVTSSDPEEAMPHWKSGKARLSAAERETLHRWIEQGARYDAHWALVAPEKAALPEVHAGGWCRDEIDRFVLARIEAAGLEPSAEAEPEILLRRATLDLTGLPPAPEEIDAFLAERAGAPEEAYEHALARLLASPHFGEHLAVGWLDLARYADTYGYQADVERRVWPWRDWVIRSFNANLPYDRFLTWQIAGDLLPEATSEQRLATAFNRLHRQTNEGGSVEEEFRVEYVADRVNTFGTAFLGLTLECARCHDHKFDPLTTRDFYSVAAFFDDIDECGLYSHFTDATPTPTLALPTPEQEQRSARARAEIACLERELGGLRETRREACERWRAGAELAAPTPVGRYPLDAIGAEKLENSIDPARPGEVYDGPELVAGRIGSALRFSGDNGARFPGLGEFHHWEPFSFAFWLSVPDVKARAVVLRRSRAWTDAGSQGYQLLIEEGRLSWSLIHFWPGNASAVRTESELPTGRWVHVVATYDGSSRADGLALYLDGARAGVEVVRDHLWKPITAGDPGPLALAERFRDAGLARGAIDELWVFDRELSGLEAAWLASTGTERALPRLEDAGSAAQLEHFLLAVDEESRALRARLREERRALAEELAALPEIMVMEELAQPRAAYVLRRGRYDDPDRARPVSPNTPAALPPLPADLPPDRRSLARWLTDPGHPLTARVTVNRVWQLLFGRGLVETAEDFGVRGSLPTHPELLDWLAVTFVESGWDLKRLIRRIALSSTYRQSSRLTPGLAGRDPANELLARCPARRLSAEQVRDQALSASGLLVETVGGPSVKPWQPPGLWSFTAGGEYVPDEGEKRHRRSLYTFWKRTVPPPNLALFDAARREICAARRASTNTPQQALVLLNDPQFVEAAGALALRSLNEAPRTEERIARLFRRLTGRRPTAGEERELTGLYEQQLAGSSAEEAAALLSECGLALPHEVLPLEWRALALVASTVLSLDASLTIR